MDSAIGAVFSVVILIFSVIVHEVSHGLVANALGDPTAKHAGRLTLNPIPHIDPIGSIVMPLLSWFAGGFVIGWAKPVPYNPFLLRVRNQELGSAIVGLAGPLSNIALAVIFGLLVRLGPIFPENLLSMVSLFATISFVNLMLAIFNLIPIPPLDGSKVLFYFLPAGTHEIRSFLEQYGFFILLFFIFFLSGVLLPVASFFFRILSGFPV